MQAFIISALNTLRRRRDVNKDIRDLQNAIKDGIRMLVIQPRGKGDRLYDKLEELAYKEFKND